MVGIRDSSPPTVSEKRFDDDSDQWVGNQRSQLNRVHLALSINQAFASPLLDNQLLETASPGPRAKFFSPSFTDLFLPVSPLYCMYVTGVSNQQTKAHT